MKYIEKNRDVLKNALSQLPQYEAPSTLWSAMEQKLEQQNAYQQSLQQLPIHQAPPGLWEVIEAHLEEENNSTYNDNTPSSEVKMPTLEVKHVKKRPFQWLKVAAIFLPFIAIGYWVLSTTTQPTYTYQTAVVSISEEGNKDASLVEDLKRMYQAQMNWNEDPKQQQLWYELQELEDALQEAKRNVGKYGEQQNILKIVKSLENNRTKVLKEMKEYI